MTRLARSLRHSIVLAALTRRRWSCLAAPRACAKTLHATSPSAHWAHAAIESVTDRGPGRPQAPRRLRRRSSGRSTPSRASCWRARWCSPPATTARTSRRSRSPTCPKGYRYYTVIQMALHHGYMTLDKDGDFQPDGRGAGRQGGGRRSSAGSRSGTPRTNWSLLDAAAQAVSAGSPTPGWKTGAPVLPPVHRRLAPARSCATTTPPTPTGTRSRPASPSTAPRSPTCSAAPTRSASEWMLYGLADYKNITFPPLSDRQKQIASFALKFIGYPYVWAGEYPTKDSPYGYQKAGGFDCSGFVFYVMKMHFGYPITVNERGAHDMAAARQAAHHAQASSSAATSSSSAPNGPESSGGVHLPRRPVPRERLVHPLDRLQRRRHAGVAQHARATTRATSPGAAGCSRRPSSPCRRRRRASAAPSAGPAPEYSPTPSPEAPAATPAPSRPRPPSA